MKKTRFDWNVLSPDVLWYLVGLITSDGSLSIDGRHIDITAKDRRFLLKVKRMSKLPQNITPKFNGKRQMSHHIQIGSVDFYRFLLTTGLTPRKSRTLGALKVPPSSFIHFLRGVIDGDGGIRSWIHPTNGREQWSLRIVSGSENFLKWLEKMILKEVGVSGGLYEDNGAGFRKFVLKYGKLAASEICNRCYLETPTSLHLRRKFKVAQSCVTSKRGWKRSKTVLKRPGGVTGRRMGLKGWVSSPATER